MRLDEKNYWELLICMTVAYFLIEVTINLLVFNQLAVKSDFLTIESMEFWGKIITGFGAALALTKGFYALREFLKIGNSDYYFAGDSLKVIIPSLLICIPLSFILQNKLIDTLVENSTPAERNKAILIASTQAAIKPHYNPHSRYGNPSTTVKLLLPIGSMKKRFLVSYYDEQYALFGAAKNCIDHGSEALCVHSNIEKAFFSYNAFHSPLKEDLYKQVITDYSSCLMEDENYRLYLVPDPQFNESKILKFHAKYMDSSSKVYESRDKLSRFRGGKEATKKWNKEIDKQWNDALRKQLGFTSTLPVGLGYADFVVHPDVQRYLREHASADQQDYIPYSEGFRDRLRKKATESLKELLPNTAIPTYVNVGEDKPLGLLIDYPEGYTTDMFSNREAQFSDEEIDRSGKRAYKAIVMPIVALGASLTFLLLNLIIVASQFIVLIIFWKDHNNKPPSGAQFACSLILACIVFSTPLLLDDGKVVKTEDTTTHKLVQIIYHYEDILTSLTGNDEKSIKKESYVKDKKSAFDKFLDSDPNYNQGDDFDVVREDDYIPVVQEPEEKRTPSFLDSIFNSDSDDAVETVDIN